MNTNKPTNSLAQLSFRFSSFTKLAASICLLLLSLTSFASEDITPDEFLKMDEKTRVLLDVRTVEEYATAHIPTALNVPVDEVNTSLASLMEFKETPIVVYCRSGKRAAKAISILEENGFTNVLHLEGDMKAWEAENRATNQAPSKN
jgi:rhodanese-related sulfurtransferase